MIDLLRAVGKVRQAASALALAVVLLLSSTQRATAQTVFATDSSFGPFVSQAQLPATGVTALSGDTALVAGGDVVRVFERDATDAWSQVATLTASDGTPNFGRSMAIDRRTIIVGADGAAFVFRRRPNVPVWHETARLAPSDGYLGFGTDVDIDRRQAIVGAPGNFSSGRPGAAYIFGTDDNFKDWDELARLEDGQVTFGSALGISDGFAIVTSGGGASRRPAYLFGRDQGGAGQWGLVKTLIASPINLLGVGIEGDVAYVYFSDPGLLGAHVFIFRRDSGGPDAWGPEPGYANRDRGSVGGVSLSGDRMADFAPGSKTVRINARNQGYLTPSEADPTNGGPHAWAPVSTLRTTGISNPTGTSTDGDTVLVALAPSGVEVLVSDVDGDGIRDGRDLCPRDPLNNVAGGCQRESTLYPVLDELIAEEAVETVTDGNRFTITATFTNTSQSVVKNPFFEVTDLSRRHLLLNSDSGRGAVGATVSPDVGDGMLSPGESMAVDFVIRIRTDDPFEFFVTFRGEPIP